MSHNVSIAGAKINNLDIFAAAVREVAANHGIAMSISDGPGTFRGWGGSTTKCERVISIANGKFDVGVISNGDGTYALNGEHNLAGYDRAWLDALPPATAQTVDGKTVGSRTGIEVAMGRVMQMNQVMTAEIAAAQAGRQCHRSYDESTHQYVLEVVG